MPLVNGQPIDGERLKRGQRVFMTHALPAALVLLVKSLPEGYAAPSLSKVLSVSGNLSQRPYRRLLGEEFVDMMLLRDYESDLSDKKDDGDESGHVGATRRRRRSPNTMLESSGLRRERTCRTFACG